MLALTQEIPFENTIVYEIAVQSRRVLKVKKQINSNRSTK